MFGQKKRDEKLEKLIDQLEDDLSGYDPQFDDYTTAAKNLETLKGIKRDDERKPDKGFAVRDVIPLFVAGIGAVVAVWQTKQISEIEDEGVVEKTKTLNTVQKPKLF